MHKSNENLSIGAEKRAHDEREICFNHAYTFEKSTKNITRAGDCSFTEKKNGIPWPHMPVQKLSKLDCASDMW